MITQREFTDMETDPRRIIAPADITDLEMLQLYYLQRGGASPLLMRGDTLGIPCFHLPRGIYLDMLKGDNPIWANMFTVAPAAFNEWIVLNPGHDIIIMAMHLETGSIGEASLEYLAGVNYCHQRRLFTVVRQLRERLRRIWDDWTSHGKPFYKLRDLPLDFCSATILTK
ncbi:MAG: hypothetical protein LBK60_11380 [Verrucomicrobiales bacterium]|jgi:hypothetical protein|nr:hypothetical protein [Verrucomicrobiales bacterium]